MFINPLSNKIKGEIEMMGIYKITNIKNGKTYIGQTNNIKRRFSEHRQNAAHGRTPLSASMKKNGIESFTFEILEECPIEKFNEREAYWIKEYKSFGQGYNCNPGGDNSQIGETNTNKKLSNKDVVLIRQAYNNHETQREVYNKNFKNIISFGHFQNIWQGRIWSHIMPEVFTEENRRYYIYDNSKGSKSERAEFSDEEVLHIRTRYQEESAKVIYEDYKDRVKLQTFQAILWGRTYKDIPIYSKSTKKWINK